MVGLVHRTGRVRSDYKTYNREDTLTRLFLHWSQPLRDFVWDLRGGISKGPRS